jgi:hypothetical protein
MEKMKIGVTLMVLAVLYGCASGSAIVTGKTRPAINHSGVRIYLDPPSQYETIGIVEASNDGRWCKSCVHGNIHRAI